MTPGAGPRGCSPEGSKIHFVHSHVAYQIEGHEEWCKTFAPGACLGVTRGQKVRFWVLFFDCHPTSLRLF